MHFARSWSAASRLQRSASAPGSCSRGWWSASGSRRANSAGSSSRRLPALAVDDFVEQTAPAGLRWSREIVGPRRVAERQQELAMAVVREAEVPFRELRLVDGGRDAADPELPRDKHHVLCRLAKVPIDR